MLIALISSDRCASVTVLGYLPSSNLPRCSGSLMKVRAPTIAIVLGLAANALCQSTGTYKAAGSEPQPWSIGTGHAVTWNSKPYLPVGVRVAGDTGSIEAALKLGYRDLVVELPSSGMGWKDAISQLEAAKSRYLISINSLSPPAQGWAVEPEAYRIAGITKRREVHVSLPGAKSVLAITIIRRDGDIQKVERLSLSAGRLDYVVSPRTDLEHVLYLFPETSSLETPDCWEGMDAHRDTLLATLKVSPPGPGLRGLLNPGGQSAPSLASELKFVPTSAYFRMEFRAFLEAKYKNLETLQRAWGMRASGIEDWNWMARLIPLWSGERAALPYFFDSETSRTYLAEPKRSGYWKDLREVVSAAIARRFERLVRAVRGVVDVPVLQEWTGWSAQTDGQAAAFDGLGMTILGSSPSSIASSGCRPLSSLLRWSRPGWSVVSRLQSGLKDSGQFGRLVDDCAQVGARAVFIDINDAIALKAGAPAGSMDAALADAPISALFFPESAMNPAMPQLLPLGKWWLPSPAAGNRIDLGSKFFAYRIEDGSQPKTVLWTSLPPGRYVLKLGNTAGVGFESLDGNLPMPKLVKAGVELAFSGAPIVVTGTSEIPIPEYALNESNFRYLAMLGVLESNGGVAAEERYAYNDPLAAFDRNPGGAFAAMREVYSKVAVRLGMWTWIEAESSRDHNFNGPATIYGVSRNSALTLRTWLDDLQSNFTANYSFLAKTGEDQEVWIAAKIPAGGLSGVAIRIGTQILKPDGTGVSPYGAGFAWYRCGITKLSPGQVRLALDIKPLIGQEYAVDSIVLFPGKFVPSGVSLPDALDFGKLAPPVKKKGGG